MTNKKKNSINLYEHQYIREKKDFLNLYKLGTLNNVLKPKIWQSVTIGNSKAWFLFGFPFIIKQIKLNLKTKWYLGPICIYTSKNKLGSKTNVLKDTKERSQYIYFSLGDIPFGDSGTGIQRVIKELCKQGLRTSKRPLIPVRLDYHTGTYRVALGWLRKNNLKLPANFPFVEYQEDPEILIKPGDWLIYTQPNTPEWLYVKNYQESLKKAGGLIGVIMYDLIPVEYPQFSTPYLKHAFPIWVRLVVQNADAIFSISQATQKSLENWIAKEKLTYNSFKAVFHLGGNFSKISNQQYTIPDVLKDRQFYMQVSTVEPRKGYSDLLDAFEQLWQNRIMATLVIVGKKGWRVESLVNRIKNHPQYGNHLFWLQGISDETLAGLYSACRAVVFASETEGFGLSAMEGLIYGKTVIVRDIPVFHEIGGSSLHYFKDGSKGLAKLLLKEWETPDSFKTSAPIKITSWEESFSQFEHAIDIATLKE